MGFGKSAFRCMDPIELRADLFIVDTADPVSTRPLAYNTTTSGRAGRCAYPCALQNLMNFFWSPVAWPYRLNVSPPKVIQITVVVSPRLSRVGL